MSKKNKKDKKCPKCKAGWSVLITNGKGETVYSSQMVLKGK